MAANGIGIPADQRNRIVEPFFRAEEAVAYPGTGLGLAICHRTMQVHGGTVRVEAPPGGTGTVFVCTFPISGSPPEVPRPLVPERSRAPF